MHSTGTLKFKSDLTPTPFHLGCNALVSHPNCGVCFPTLRWLTLYRRQGR